RSAKSRTISRTACWSSLRSKAGPAELASASAATRSGAPVLVEAAAALAPQVPGGDHLAQQRARAVLGIAEPLVQHLHDAEAGVEPDEVGERQGTERVVHPQLHHRVDRFLRGHAFHQA